MPKFAIGRLGVVDRKMRKRGLSSRDTHASLNATLSEGKYARHLLTLVVAWGPLCTTFRRRAKKRISYLCSVFNLPSARPRLVPLPDKNGRRARKNNKDDGDAKRFHGKAGSVNIHSVHHLFFAGIGVGWKLMFYLPGNAKKASRKDPEESGGSPLFSR